MYSSFPKIMMSTSKSLKSEGIMSSNEASSASSKFVYSPVVSEPSTSCETEVEIFQQNSLI